MRCRPRGGLPLPVRAGRSSALPSRGSARYPIVPAALGRFLCDVFDCWRADFRDGQPDGYSEVSCGLERYDLESDVGEQHDVAAQHPDVVQRLQALAEPARVELGDALAKRLGKKRRPPGKVQRRPPRPAGRCNRPHVRPAAESILYVGSTT
jgi:hypothetical protein